MHCTLGLCAGTGSRRSCRRAPTTMSTMTTMTATRLRRGTRSWSEFGRSCQLHQGAAARTGAQSCRFNTCPASRMMATSSRNGPIRVYTDSVPESAVSPILVYMEGSRFGLASDPQCTHVRPVGSDVRSTADVQCPGELYNAPSSHGWRYPSTINTRTRSATCSKEALVV